MIKTSIALTLSDLGLILLGGNVSTVRQPVQNDRQPQECKKRLVEWKHEEDLGIRIYYSPGRDIAYPPLIFLPMSPLDQRLGTSDREVIGITPAEMRALLEKLANTTLEWKAY